MRKTGTIIISIIAWFALAAQYYLIIENRVEPVAETTIRYFSFFTILTNLLVAIVITKEIFKENSRSFFTAVTVYITIVGAVYQVLLRHIWSPTGLQKLVDELLHTIIPLLVIIYWCTWKNKVYLTYRKIFAWAIYPLVYFGYILLRGASSHFYPYPFINVDTLGYTQVLINSFFILLVFVLVSSIYIWIARYVSRKE